jgi:hypothetical protein
VLRVSALLVPLPRQPRFPLSAGDVAFSGFDDGLRPASLPGFSSASRG